MTNDVKLTQEEWNPNMDNDNQPLRSHIVTRDYDISNEEINNQSDDTSEMRLRDYTSATAGWDWEQNYDNMPESEFDRMKSVIVSGNRVVRIYVGGPIAGLDPQLVKQYQQQVIDVLDMLAKQFVVTFDITLPTPVSTLSDEYTIEPEDIVACDSHSVMQADICIFCHNLKFQEGISTGPSVGTNMEQALAWQSSSHVIVFTHTQTENISPWILAKADEVALDTEELAQSVTDCLSLIKDEQAIRSNLTRRVLLTPEYD
jgi:hypothetical protein